MAKQTVIKFILVAVLAFNGSVAFSVSEENVWVPKRYTVAKHKLLSTAVEAERTERCERVILGEMSVEKTSDDFYYFIITCRDKARKSYNLSYHYPVAGGAPILLNEQLSKQPEQELEPENPTVSRDQAWPLCLASAREKTVRMLDVVIVEDDPSPSDVGLEKQHVVVPFEARNPQGQRLRYQLNCDVDVELNLRSKIGIRR